MDSIKADIIDYDYFYAQGVCGAFSKDNTDTFVTPEGDVEEDPIDFINK